MDDLYAELERERQEAGQTFQDVQGDPLRVSAGRDPERGKNGQFGREAHHPTDRNAGRSKLARRFAIRLRHRRLSPRRYQHILGQHTSRRARFIGV